MNEDSENDDDVLNDDEYIDVNTDPCQEETLNEPTSLNNHQGADNVFVKHFPSSNAGAAIYEGSIAADYDYYQKQCGNSKEYAPFASRMNWDIARWAKLHGITSTAVSELLGIKGVGFYTTRNV